MNDAEKLRRHEQLSNAFSEIEFKICDVKNMSIIAELTIENSWRYETCDDKSEEVMMRLSRDEFNSMQFAVMHLGNMIRDLHAAYYAAFKDGKDTPIVAPCRFPSNQTQ